jgi:hypothetical protein
MHAFRGHIAAQTPALHDRPPKQTCRVHWRSQPLMRRQAAATRGGARRARPRAHRHTLTKLLQLPPPSKAAQVTRQLTPRRCAVFMRTARRLWAARASTLTRQHTSQCMKPTSAWKPASQNQHQLPLGYIAASPFQSARALPGGLGACLVQQRGAVPALPCTRAGSPAGAGARRALSSRPRAGTLAARPPTPRRARAARAASPAAAWAPAARQRPARPPRAAARPC